MIDHRRALTLAATAIDFPLSAADRDALDAHARDCSDCRAELVGLRRDAARLAALPPIAPPAWVRDSIGRTRRPNPFMLLVAAVFLLTATGLAVVIGSGILRDRTAVVVPTPHASPSAATSPAVVPTSAPSSPPSMTATPGGYLLVRRTGPAQTEPVPVTFGLIDLASGTYRSLGVAVDAALSADGRRIHLVEEDATCTPTLVTLDLQGVELLRVQGGFKPGDGPFAWSPDDSRVVFGRYVNGEPKGMCHSQDGTFAPTDLSSATIVIDAASEWAIGSPVVATPKPARYAWSPNGRSISMTGSTPRLWVINTTSTALDLGPALTTIGADDPWDARWSPDGSSIAFAYSSPVGNMVGVAVVAGQTARTVGPYGDVTNAPVWAPDGRSIAVVRSQKGGILALLDPASVRPELLLEQASIDELAPFGWSPDGYWIACTADDGTVAAVSTTGSAVLTVFRPPAGSSVRFVGWSPG